MGSPMANMLLGQAAPVTSLPQGGVGSMSNEELAALAASLQQQNPQPAASPSPSPAAPAPSPSPSPAPAQPNPGLIQGLINWFLGGTSAKDLAGQQAPPPPPTAEGLAQRNQGIAQ